MGKNWRSAERDFIAALLNGNGAAGPKRKIMSEELQVTDMIGKDLYEDKGEEARGSLEL